MLGLRFQIGQHRLALDVRDIIEVVPAVRLQAVADGPTWLAGMALIRGQVVPVLDLYRLMNAGDCPGHLSTRIILVQVPLDGQLRLLGLKGGQVADIREMPTMGDRKEEGDLLERPDLGAVYVEQGEMIHCVCVARLLPESIRRAAFAAC